MFKIGDRVISKSLVGMKPKRNVVGTIIYISPNISIDVEFDENIGGHDGYEIDKTNTVIKGKDGHCWWVSPCEIELYNKNRRIIK